MVVRYSYKKDIVCKIFKDVKIKISYFWSSGTDSVTIKKFISTRKPVTVSEATVYYIQQLIRQHT